MDAPAVELGVLRSSVDPQSLGHILLMAPRDHQAPVHVRHLAIEPLDGQNRVSKTQKLCVCHAHPAQPGCGHAEELDFRKVAKVACLEDVRARGQTDGTQPAPALRQLVVVRKSGL